MTDLIQLSPEQKILSDQFDALWPEDQDAPGVVIVSGEIGKGKTRFALGTGAHPSRMLDVDFEKSGVCYAKQMKFPYWDIQEAMNAKYPEGYTMIQLFEKFRDMVRAVPDGMYDVIVLDNVKPLEEGITAYVEANPGKFSLTPAQINSAGGLKWGQIKLLWEQILMRLATKAKMVVVIVHMRDVWANNRPVLNPVTGLPKREPSGKNTLEKLSSLFVVLETGSGGVPAAKVLKCRIAKSMWVEDAKNPPAGIPDYALKELKGEPYGMVTVPVIPLRLPKCTWQEIRNYMTHPADLRNPKLGEALTKADLSEDDRLMMRARIAEADATVADAQKLIVQSGMYKKKENLFKMAMDEFKMNEDAVKRVMQTKGFVPFNAENWESMRNAIAEASGVKNPTPSTVVSSEEALAAVTAAEGDFLA